MAVGNQEDHPFEAIGFCSDDCNKQFFNRLMHFSLHKYVLTDTKNLDANIVTAWNKAIVDVAHDSYKKRAINACTIHSMQYPAFPWWDLASNNYLPVYCLFYKKGKTALAENLEKCGRIEDAAKIYEELQMYDKARNLRESERHIVVKSTNLSVNLNSLLQQLKDGGLVAVFRCPFCGGKLKINKETSVDKLRQCEHCGSEISTIDIEDFLKTVLN